MPTNIRDPRSIITPDAFGIEEGLLGLPLADPWRRFWAMLVDLVVIGLLTVFLDSIQLLIWGVVALFFIRMALQSRGAASQAAGILLRVFAGCLGLTILTAVLIAWLVFRSSGDGTPRMPNVATPDVPGVGDVRGLSGMEALGALGVVEELHDAWTPDEAVAASVGVLDALLDEGDDEDDALQILRFATPEDAPWADAADSIYEVAVERWREQGAEPGEGDAARSDLPAGGGAEEATAGTADTAGTASVDDSVAVADAVAGVEALSDGEVLAAYASLLEERERADGGAEGEGVAGTPAETAAGRARAEALRRRAVDLVAADTLSRLEAGLDDLGGERDDLARDVRRISGELESERSSFTALLRDIWDQAGSAIGLWSIYFTVLLTLWKGQTVGKRFLGIRVLRLDGEPMTWWTSFERGGGYVAGIATGLLGFAQVFWDPNRQCIHDKVVGTVVVRTGAEAVPGAWQEAHAGTGSDESFER